MDNKEIVKNTQTVQQTIWCRCSENCDAMKTEIHTMADEGLEWCSCGKVVWSPKHHHSQ